MTQSHAWWQTEITYQIYPRSFQDSNADGVGDLPGVTSRLDYLKNLNVGAVWLSPIYPSPMHDFGYDVADYCDIHPMFGTMADFDHLLAETHKRGMKLILDLVPNHTSDEHPWFLESRSSRANPKRDWYLWRDPAPDGGVPNNWLSHFGGPAWTFDEKTGQYYLHQFVKQQPDLNYRNPEVVAALMNTMRFWLDKGVDGFRVDVIGLMMKDPDFRDEPLNPDWDGKIPWMRIHHIYTANLPEVHDLVRQMRAVLDSYDDRMMVGETYLPNDELMKYYGTPGKLECHLPFNFQLIRIPRWDAALVRSMVDAYEAALPPFAWPNWVLGNHDQHRLATRYGPAQARVANMLLLTLRGAPTCYYGDEIGMEDVPIPLDRVMDPPAINQPEIAHIVGRDPERTPMQWDTTPNAGFSPAGVETWLPLADDHATRNVAVQSTDPASMLTYYRALTTLRQSTPALTVGAYQSVDAGSPDVFAYLRSDGDTRLLVVLNFSGDSQALNLSAVGSVAGVMLSTEMTGPREVALKRLEVKGNEGVVLKVK
ncbi:MAG: alpha-glucosidase C-terminal domain-containing protein [Anaerolineales bacterium]|nr:alpha-glucosidase C-terminal domain-containing protein [Anaerolineales bacterium]